MDSQMPVPAAVRHHITADDKLWASLVSLFISPPLVWAVWVFSIALSFTPQPAAALFFGTVYALTVCLLPMLFIARRVRAGKISDLHMRESHERYAPYSLAIIAAAFTGLVFAHFGAHPVLLTITLVSIVELSLMLLGTFFNHISLHAMAMTSIASATTILYGFSQSLIFIPFILLVVLARLALKRHTPVQIMIGVLIGALTPLAVVAALPLIVR